MNFDTATDDRSIWSVEHVKRSLPLPADRVSLLSSPTLVIRQDSSSTSESTTAQSCGPKDTTGACARYHTLSSNTIPIVLGVVIPLGAAFCVLIYLHRRHIKKLKREDAEDKTKSWDFGMDGVPVSSKTRKGKKGGSREPEMSAADVVKTIRHDRGGISMDMGLSNPYLLPPELHQSRESLHSLTRSMTTTGDDKYRATDFIPDDGSIRSPSSMRSHWDNASTFTGSSRPRLDSESTKNLIRVPTRTEDSVPMIRKPLPVAKDLDRSLPAPPTEESTNNAHVKADELDGYAPASEPSRSNSRSPAQDAPLDEQQQQQQQHGHTVSTYPMAELDSVATVPQPAPALINNQSGKRTSVVPDTAGFNFGIPNGVQELPARYSRQSEARELPANHQPSLPQVSVTGPDNHNANYPQDQTTRESSVYEENFATFSNHPNAYAWPANRDQPPDQHEAHPDSYNANQQTTANYGETHDGHHDYIDAYDSTQPSDQAANPNSLHPNGRYSEGYDHHANRNRQSNMRASGVDYYDEEEDSYDLADYQDVLGYDPRLLTMGMRPLPPDDPTENPEERANRIRSFYKEYFDEVSKPGGGNRMSYFDGGENFYDDYYGTAHSSMSRPHTQQQRHRAMSNGSYGPRAFSSASGRYGRPPFKPKKKLPPPAALNLLPTPYKLKDDSMLPNPIEYAPPQLFKNQRSGTPDGGRGGLRPYSPSTRAFNPLVSAFDDLAVLPSPHQLRKSSTFTSLDFAPPRFQVKENMSETGSIRSNRSGLSAMQKHNIRAGAYRVSRIPKEVAGTKDELASALRPQWDMGR